MVDFYKWDILAEFIRTELCEEVGALKHKASYKWDAYNVKSYGHSPAKPK